MAASGSPPRVPPEDSSLPGSAKPAGADPAGLTPEQLQKENRRVEQAQFEARKQAVHEIYPRYQFGRSRFKQIDKTNVKEENDALRDDAPGLSSGNQDSKDKDVKPGYYKNIDTKYVVEITANGGYRPVIPPPPTFEARCWGLLTAMQLARENGVTEIVYDIANPKYANRQEMEFVLKWAPKFGLKAAFGDNVTKAFMEPNSTFIEYRSPGSNAIKGDLLAIDKHRSPIANEFPNNAAGQRYKEQKFQRMLETMKANNDAIDAKVDAKLKTTPPGAKPPAAKPPTPPAPPRP